MKKVLLIGRPNVGKSSLFNRLIKQRRALVLDLPGVTRDILKEKAFWWGGEFEVWDSGGLISKTNSVVFSSVKKSVEKAITAVDLIIFITDARAGLNREDQVIFKLIKEKKHLFVVNKVDNKNLLAEAFSEFSKLGEEFIPASFEKEDNVDKIVEWILKNSTQSSKTKKEEKSFSILLAGKSNVGKSSLCNRILSKERVIISPKEHTTVDVVNESFEYEGKKYEILDTAGIRQKSRRSNDLEKLSAAKSLVFFEKAGLILLLISADKGFHRQDLRLISYAMARHKACLLVVNKWDLKKLKSTKKDWRRKVLSELPFFPDMEMVFTSAKTGLGVKTLMKKIKEQVQKVQFRVSTSELNRFTSKITQNFPCPLYGTKVVRFYYWTQVKKTPPSFIAFTNEPKGVRPSYKKFLVKQIKKQWSLPGVPVELNFIKKK